MANRQLIIFLTHLSWLLPVLAACEKPVPPLDLIPTHEEITPPATKATTIPASTATQILTSTASKSATRIPTQIPSPTVMQMPDFCVAADGQEEINVVSTFIFDAMLPGSPRIFDRILIAHNTAWMEFQQVLSGEMHSAGVIFHEISFGPELGTGVNPAVVLVTYGLSNGWELPPDGDLISEVDQIRAALFDYHLAWLLGQVDPTQFPPMANAASYALYRYFNGEAKSLEAWCHTFVDVFSESPLKSN